MPGVATVASAPTEVLIWIVGINVGESVAVDVGVGVSVAVGVGVGIAASGWAQATSNNALKATRRAKTVLMGRTVVGLTMKGNS